MNKLIIANLLQRPLRSIISVLAVAIEVVMILSIVGIFMGMLNDTKQRTNGVGADLMMRPSNASMFTGIGGAPILIRNIEPIRRLPHVVVASPVNVSFSTAGAVEILYGIDYTSFNALKSFVFLSGGPFQGPYDVIIDDVLARTKGGLHVGDSINIFNHPFRICGIVEAGKGGRKLLPIDTMGVLTGADGKASVFYIKVDDPANDEAVIQEIHATRGLEDYPVQTMEDWNSPDDPRKAAWIQSRTRGGYRHRGHQSASWSSSSRCIRRCLSARAKSASSSRWARRNRLIVGVVLRETAVMAVAGVLVGIAGTYGVKIPARPSLPHPALSKSRRSGSPWPRLSHSLDPCAALSIRPGWRRGRIRLMRWRTNSRCDCGNWVVIRFCTSQG